MTKNVLYTVSSPQRFQRMKITLEIDVPASGLSRDKFNEAAKEMAESLTNHITQSRLTFLATEEVER